MTVHGAKGLEAPIVFLPDTTSGADQQKADPLLMLEGGGSLGLVPLWPVPNLKASRAVKALKAAQKDVATAEYRRLLYVAMTRACDELYLCGYRGEREPSETCWYNTARDALVPHMEPLGEEQGWRLGTAPAEVFEDAVKEAREDTDLQPGWLAREVSGPAGDTDPPPSPRRRAHSRVARGILIHRILQNLPDLAAEERVPHIEAAVRRAGADPALVRQLTELVSHPVLAEILSGDGHSEASLITRTADGLTERRRIDRLVVTESGILVADYKTDRLVPETPEACNPEYLMQLAVYREALRLAQPGKPLRFCLVYTEAPKLMLIEDPLLDRMAALRPARP